MNATNQVTYWVNRFGEKIPLDEMETGYLYNTVKMIWNNHLMPRNPFGDVIHWNFARPEHTPEFLEAFFHVGLKELKFRKDVECALDFLRYIEQFKR
jgi:hypothetical protein